MSGTFFAAPTIILLALLAYFAGFTNVHVDVLGGQGQQKNDTVTAFENIWPDIRTKLYPKLRPNINYGRNLFLATQRQLGMSPIEDSAELSAFQHFIGEERFWTFQSGGWIYTPKDGGVSTIYLRIFKAGNNQLMSGYETILSGSRAEGNYTRFDKLHDIPRQILKNACIVTAVRDPVERWLSGYNEIEYRAAEVRPERMNSNHTAQFHRFQYGTEQRFDQFVRDFIGGPARDLKIQYGHIYSMTGVLYRLDEDVGATLTSYLSSLQNLTHTFPDFITSTCPSLPKSAQKPMSLHGQHVTSGDPLGFYAAAKEAWKKQATTARALCTISAMDYACYEKLPVPPLCQEVFADESFVRSFAQ